MPSYADFAGFYDQIMGDRSALVARVRGYLWRFAPDAGSLLELGCGTGAVLAGLGENLQLTGVDRSPEMLAIAARKLTGVRLVEADITGFSLGARFDVAICVFDTLNHLPSFGAWRAMFGRVDAHLNDGGLFIFDVNTVGRLSRLASAPAHVEDFGPHTLVMDVAVAGEDGVYPWDVRIFERVGGDEFRLHHERIGELGVPLARIHEALAPRFELLEAANIEGRPATDESDRAYFVYRRRAPAESGGSG
jgi:SAM-dependent methyltransferase